MLIDTFMTIIYALLDAVPDIVLALVDTLPAVIDAIVGAIPIIVEALINMLFSAKFWIAIGKLLLAIAKLLISLITGLFKGVGAVFKGIGKGLANAGKKLNDSTGQFFTKTIPDFFKKTIPETFKKVWEKITGFFSSIFSTGDDNPLFADGSPLKPLKDFFNGIKNIMKEIGAVWEEGGALGVMKYFFKKITDFFSNIFDTIGSFFSYIANTDNIQTLFSDFISGNIGAKMNIQKATGGDKEASEALYEQAQNLEKEKSFSQRKYTEAEILKMDNLEAMTRAMLANKETKDSQANLNDVTKLMAELAKIQKDTTLSTKGKIAEMEKISKDFKFSEDNSKKNKGKK
jgi:hypothetical protein